MGQFDEKLFAALGKTAERRLVEFNAQELVNTAWAFAKVGQFDEKLFAALRKVADRLLCEFNVQALANTAWA